MKGDIARNSSGAVPLRIVLLCVLGHTRSRGKCEGPVGTWCRLRLDTRFGTRSKSGRRGRHKFRLLFRALQKSSTNPRHKCGQNCRHRASIKDSSKPNTYTAAQTVVCRTIATRFIPLITHQAVFGRTFSCRFLPGYPSVRRRKCSAADCSCWGVPHDLPCRPDSLKSDTRYILLPR